MELLFQQPARLRLGRVLFQGSEDETLKTELEETILPLRPKAGFVKQICHPQNIIDPYNSICQYILPF